MKNDIAISIFIPAFNASGFIEGVIKRISDSVWQNVKTCWIINDGSTDNTADIIADIEKRYEKVVAIHFDSNVGYGRTVQKGLALCKNDSCDVAVCLHSDGQYPPEFIEKFANEIVDNKYDILQGSRLSSGTALSGGMPVYKFVAGKVLTFFENIVFGLSMTDYHSGFLCYSRKALDIIRFESLSSSFDFDLEIIASAVACGLKVGEFPIPTRYADEESHLNPVTYGMRVLGVMLKYIAGKYKPVDLIVENR